MFMKDSYISSEVTRPTYFSLSFHNYAENELDNLPSS